VEDEEPLNLKQAIHWLFQPIPAADFDLQVDKRMENLNSKEEAIQMWRGFIRLRKAW